MAKLNIKSGKVHDVQKTRVYLAESLFQSIIPLQQIQPWQAGRFLDMLLTHPLWKEKYGDVTIPVFRPKRRNSFVSDMQVGWMPNRQQPPMLAISWASRCNPRTVYHEVAHRIVDDRNGYTYEQTKTPVPGHGHEFRVAMAQLLRDFISEAHAEALELAYNVVLNAPRTLDRKMIIEEFVERIPKEIRENEHPALINTSDAQILFEPQKFKVLRSITVLDKRWEATLKGEKG